MKFYYKVYVSYLGFRYFGWQKQKEDILTVQGTIEKAVSKFYTEGKFKTLGASRTDAKVSAFEQVFVLTIEKEFDPLYLLSKLNDELPQDIRILDVESCNKNFRVINDVKYKEYHYYFSNDQTSSPFFSPLIPNFEEKLDLDLMKKTSSLFLGSHNFINFTVEDSKDKIYQREILQSEIVENKNNFHTNEIKSYIYIVRSSGFLRHQVRIMVGTLLNVGFQKTDIELVKASLKGEEVPKTGFMAPSSGLFLKKIFY